MTIDILPSLASSRQAADLTDHLLTASKTADLRYTEAFHRHLEVSAKALREELYAQLKATVSHDHVTFEGSRAVTRLGGYRFTVDLGDEATLPCLRVELLCPACGERGWSSVVMRYDGLERLVRRPVLSGHFCEAVPW